MKIIFSGLEHNNYSAKKGTSFEKETFLKTLQDLPGVEVVYFSFDHILKVGKRRFNQELLELIKKEKPDLFLAYMYTDEFEVDALEEIKKYTTSLAWYADDSWRFWNYTRRWAPHFTWNITTYSWITGRAQSLGLSNFIRSQWAADIKLFHPPTTNIFHPEVSFVGTWSRPRQKVIDALKRAGIKVEIFGNGWEKARRVTQDEMIQIFNGSKINLGLNPAPGLWTANSLGRLVLKSSINKIVPDFHLGQNLKAWLERKTPQIKARHFEIPACRGFTLTSPADDLSSFYKYGKEIAVYRSTTELIEKIKYYLEHEEERLSIAEAGYQRTIKDHTYAKRFQDIFSRIGITFK